MAIFITNLEVILASEEEVNLYYETLTKKINDLLAKYDIRDSKNKLEIVSANAFKVLLSFNGFFQATPLKSIFFEQKQQFVPQEIIDASRKIISDPPKNIKAVFFNKFLTLLTKKGWDKPLSAYFEKYYNFPSDGSILLEDVKDFSIGYGVYRVTFQLRTLRKEKITVFLKKTGDSQPCNERLYASLQKQFLPTANYAKMPFILSNEESKEALLLSHVIPGAASDIIFSKLTHAYRDTKYEGHQSILNEALEILIEAFFRHAALGDLLGRNDRHLLNSHIASIVSGVPRKSTPEDLNSLEKILAFAKSIVTTKTKAFSLISFDLAWLLGEKNARWIFVDIDFGLSELNLLSLLDAFNDYNAKTNPYYEKRKEYIKHYFNVYCQKQAALLEKKENLYTAIKKFYPANESKEKLKILTQEVNRLEKNEESIFNLFERYLMDYRVRMVHKEILFALHTGAIQSNDDIILNALKDADLLKFIPPQSDFSSTTLNVFIQLQCFRGILSEKDLEMLSEEGRTSWETIASNISMIAKKTNGKLFHDLQDKIQFIKNDTAALLKGLRRTETKDNCVSIGKAPSLSYNLHAWGHN